MNIIIKYWNPHGVKVEREFTDLALAFEIAAELAERGVSFIFNYSAV